MNRVEILERVNDIFRDAFDDEEMVVAESTVASDIEGWDSLMQMNLLEMIEDEFGFQFTMDEAGSLKNVGDMISVVEAHI